VEVEEDVEVVDDVDVDVVVDDEEVLVVVEEVDEVDEVVVAPRPGSSNPPFTTVGVSSSTMTPLSL
jgi:hypothetical protein